MPLANVVPLSADGWLTVLWLTVGAAVLWIVGVVVVSRQKAAHSPGRGVQTRPPKEPGTAAVLGARTVLVAAVGLAVVVLVVFLVGRAGDLLV